jgi:hypothetical protein
MVDPLCGGGTQSARVLRGGSWNNTRNNARCARRNRNNPNNRNRNNGFRVCCSHICLAVWPEMPPGYGWVAEAVCSRGTHERWRVPSLAESYASCIGRANIESVRLLGLVP